jgi:hypothetical protein
VGRNNAVGLRNPDEAAHLSGTGVTHVRPSLVAHLAAGLTLWPIVRSEDDKRVVVDREFLERVEDLTDVVIAFH